jgi:hypothetical protein
MQSNIVKTSGKVAPAEPQPSLQDSAIFRFVFTSLDVV